MPKNVDTAYQQITKLVENFDTHKRAYLSSEYTEARARQDFIDKFLAALGWDVVHDYQRNPFEQEVKVERNVQTGLRVPLPSASECRGD